MKDKLLDTFPELKILLQYFDFETFCDNPPSSNIYLNEVSFNYQKYLITKKLLSVTVILK